MQLWGILNVTPDSFSDGGRFIDPAAAIAHARRMRLHGATVIDVGGESTRPGATPIDRDEEQARILPVISELANEGFVVSVDTVHAATARVALDAGAQIINDVTAGAHDPDMFAVVAQTGATIVLMHSRGIDPTTNTHYDDIVGSVVTGLTERIEAARAAGIQDRQILLDPGFGFSKDADDNWRLLNGLRSVVAIGFPVLVGTSRKRFLGASLPHDHAPEDRDIATAVTTVLAAERGAVAARVHDVRSSADALAVLAATGRARVGTTAMIELTGLRSRGYHGVFEHERREGQDFVVDLELELDATRAIEHDDVTHTVHYGHVAERVAEIVTGEPVDLIETLADRIADAILAFAGARAVRVTVHKPDAPIDVTFGDVSVRITKERT